MHVCACRPRVRVCARDSVYRWAEDTCVRACVCRRNSGLRHTQKNPKALYEL